MSSSQSLWAQLCSKENTTRLHLQQKNSHWKSWWMSHENVPFSVWGKWRSLKVKLLCIHYIDKRRCHHQKLSYVVPELTTFHIQVVTMPLSKRSIQSQWGFITLIKPTLWDYCHCYLWFHGPKLQDIVKEFKFHLDFEDIFLARI